MSTSARRARLGHALSVAAMVSLPRRSPPQSPIGSSKALGNGLTCLASRLNLPTATLPRARRSSRHAHCATRASAFCRQTCTRQSAAPNCPKRVAGCSTDRHRAQWRPGRRYRPPPPNHGLFGPRAGPVPPSPPDLRLQRIPRSCQPSPAFQSGAQSQPRSPARRSKSPGSRYVRSNTLVRAPRRATAKAKEYGPTRRPARSVLRVLSREWRVPRRNPSRGSLQTPRLARGLHHRWPRLPRSSLRHSHSEPRARAPRKGHVTMADRSATSSSRSLRDPSRPQWCPESPRQPCRIPRSRRSTSATSFATVATVCP